MTLNTTVSGPETPGLPPVIVAHGLFGQGRNLGVIARGLAETRRVIACDMRNHGDSFWDDDHSYDALAGDLAAVIAANGGEADVVGHSMGGKASMWLALTHPGMVRRLAVLDIAPVAYRHSQAELIDAMEQADFTGSKTRSQADMALSEFVEDHSVRAFLLQSLDLKADPPRWRMNLAALRDQMPGLTGWPAADEGMRFDGPMLVLAGGDSDYVDDAGRAAIAALFPKGTVETVGGTGHWLHAEKPAEVSARIAAFLG